MNVMARNKRALWELFPKLTTARDMLQAHTGRDFEDRLDAAMHRGGFSRLQPDDLDDWRRIKALVQDHEIGGGIPNDTQWRKHFVYQPAGSQQYPDFLVMDGDVIFGIETKFSKARSGKPVWNSGHPRPSGIYVYACAAHSDLTFFRGADVLSPSDVRILHEGIEAMAATAREHNLRLSGQPRGFHIYPRAAYQQGRQFTKDADLNFFESPSRSELEASAVEFLRSGFHTAAPTA